MFFFSICAINTFVQDGCILSPKIVFPHINNLRIYLQTNPYLCWRWWIWERYYEDEVLGVKIVELQSSWDFRSLFSDLSKTSVRVCSPSSTLRVLSHSSMISTWNRKNNVEESLFTRNSIHSPYKILFVPSPTVVPSCLLLMFTFFYDLLNLLL